MGDFICVITIIMMMISNLNAQVRLPWPNHFHKEDDKIDKFIDFKTRVGWFDEIPINKITSFTHYWRIKKVWFSPSDYGLVTYDIDGYYRFYMQMANEGTFVTQNFEPISLSITNYNECSAGLSGTVLCLTFKDNGLIQTGPIARGNFEFFAIRDDGIPVFKMDSLAGDKMIPFYSIQTFPFWSALPLTRVITIETSKMEMGCSNKSTEYVLGSFINTLSSSAKYTYTVSNSDQTRVMVGYTRSDETIMSHEVGILTGIEIGKAPVKGKIELHYTFTKTDSITLSDEEQHEIINTTSTQHQIEVDLGSGKGVAVYKSMVISECVGSTTDEIKFTEQIMSRSYYVKISMFSKLTSVSFLYGVKEVKQMVDHSEL